MFNNREETLLLAGILFMKQDVEKANKYFEEDHLQITDLELGHLAKRLGSNVDDIQNWIVLVREKDGDICERAVFLNKPKSRAIEFAMQYADDVDEESLLIKKQELEEHSSTRNARGMEIFVIEAYSVFKGDN